MSVRSMTGLRDYATVFMMKGPSFRGVGLETYALETAPVATKAKRGTLQVSK